MMHSPQQLAKLLQDQRDTARRLLQILDREHIVLSGKNLQDLDSILAAKQECMSQLEESAQAYSALTRNQSNGGGAGIAASLRYLDPQGSWGLAALWQQVEDLLRQCRSKNTTNGKIIALSHRHVQQALAILRNGIPGADSCYNPRGDHSNNVTSRTLGKV